MVVEAEKKTLGFQAEVKQLLSLVINSLYSNKEIFLRELISNASDAMDKLRFVALSDNTLYENSPDLKITIKKDKKAGTLTISDNGIGMNREEIIANLGTIAKSGTKDFISTLSGDQARDSQLIGQFGVGFYSSFIVAHKVVVLSRRAGEPVAQGVRWESTGTGDYTVESVDKPTRGTDIILFVKPEEVDFLDEWRIRTIVQRYSDHIAFPIELESEVFKEKEDGDPEENSKEPPEVELKLEVINQAQALWTRNKGDVTDEQFIEFYKHLTHDYEAPLTWTLNRVEGKLEYISLLFIPGHAPFDMWNREKPRGLKLYVKRVFILDNAEQFLPLYLRFIKGVLDSNDLPLNVSRELLQSDKTTETIRGALVKRILSMIEKLAEDPEKYNKFWQHFGEVLKEGPIEDFANREQIAKLLRFCSTHQDSSKPEINLTDYVARMKEDQAKIYYLIADSYNAAKNSPHLEIFRKQGVEVLLLSDRIDEWLMGHLTEFSGKPMQNIAKGNLDLKETVDEKQKQQQDSDFAGVVRHLKEVLDKRVKDVRLTYRLTQSPACVVGDDQDMTGHLQRILQAAGQEAPVHLPILEINPEHKLVMRLREEHDDARFKQWALVLLDQAILSEGGSLSDPAEFVRRMNEFLLEAQ